MSETADPKYCFVAVCQQGILELQALLLFASVKRHARVPCDLAAAIPQPESDYGRPSEKTIEQLNALGVRTFDVINPIGADYPIGNKLGCLGLETRADRIVFLDTDMICLRSFGEVKELNVSLGARVASRDIENSESTWDLLYDKFDLPKPAGRVTSFVGQELMMPYFNAGFIVADPQIDFASEWIRCSVEIEKDSRITNKRPWLDQLALPIAAAKLGHSVTELDLAFNYPPRLRQNLNQYTSPLFYHYNNPRVLAGYDRALAEVRSLADAYPIIKTQLLDNEEWQDVPANRAAAINSISYPGVDLKTKTNHRETEDNHHSNIIVTGFPRSGTSLFSASINSFENAVCINEVLPNADLQMVFSELRKEIEEKGSVRNKVDAAGSLTTNTINEGTHINSVSVSVQDNHFLLAQKFTLRYLVQLDRLVAEGWDVWVLVRDPVYTLASWMRCPADWPVRKLNPPSHWFREVPFSSEEDWHRLVDIWNYFAARIDSVRDQINVVRYEDLIEDFPAVMKSLLSRYNIGEMQQAPELVPSNSPGRYELDPIFANFVKQHALGRLFNY